MPGSGPPVPDKLKTNVTAILDAIHDGARPAEDHLQVLVDGEWRDRWLFVGTDGAWALIPTRGITITRNTFDLLCLAGAGDGGGFKALGVDFVLEPAMSSTSEPAQAVASAL